MPDPAPNYFALRQGSFKRIATWKYSLLSTKQLATISTESVRLRQMAVYKRAIKKKTRETPDSSMYVKNRYLDPLLQYRLSFTPVVVNT